MLAVCPSSPLQGERGPVLFSLATGRHWGCRRLCCSRSTAPRPLVCGHVVQAANCLGRWEPPCPLPGSSAFSLTGRSRWQRAHLPCFCTLKITAGEGFKIEKLFFFSFQGDIILQVFAGARLTDLPVLPLAPPTSNRAPDWGCYCRKGSDHCCSGSILSPTISSSLLLAKLYS